MFKVPALTFVIIIFFLVKNASPQSLLMSHEFQVNSYVVDNQFQPSVASLVNGGFVAVWRSYDQGGQGGEIWARTFDRQGNATSPEIHVNQLETNLDQYDPVVTGLSNGYFVIVWVCPNIDSQNHGIAGKIFNSSGGVVKSDFIINSLHQYTQTNPRLTSTDDGFVVTWTSVKTVELVTQGISGKFFLNDGTDVSGELHINSEISDSQIRSDVCIRPDNFNEVIFVWESHNQDPDSSIGIYCQIYSSITYTPIGPEFRINNVTENSQVDPKIACLNDGKFVVTYVSSEQDGDGDGIFMRIFDDNNNALSNMGEIQVNVKYTDAQNEPDITSLMNGDFFITYTCYNLDGTFGGICGSFYENNGLVLYEEFIVNVYKDSDQDSPTVSTMESNEIVVLYASNNIDGDMFGVFGRILKYNWNCYGISRFQNDVCNGNGLCTSFNKCTCNEPFKGNECESFECFDIDDNDHDNVCNGVGNCIFRSSSEVPYSICICNQNYYGSKCEELVTICYYSKEDEIICNYDILQSLIPFANEHDTIVPCVSHVLNVGDLGTNPSCFWESSSSSMNNFNAFIISLTSNINDIKTLRFRAVTNSSEYFMITVSPYLDFTVFIFIGISIGIIGLFMILICIFITIMIFICCILMKAQKKLKKVNELDDLELQAVIDEKKAEKNMAENNFAQIHVNKKLFEVSQKDVKLLEEIGKGGSGDIVYKSEWNGKIIAYKIFKTCSGLFETVTNYEDFEKEVSLMASLSHPNILQFYGASCVPPRVGILLEFCSNGDLIQFYSSHVNDKIPFDLKISISIGIASGLEYLHNKNVIHRDVKAKNVLISNSIEPKICDFGLSKLYVNMKEDHKTKRIGTAYYMAPEVFRSSNYTISADVFSFAILLWEIFHENFTPYGREELSGVEFKVASTPEYRPIISKDQSIPKELEELMKNMWNDNPNERKKICEVRKILQSIQK